jgi:hypothetical protein
MQWQPCFLWETGRERSGHESGWCTHSHLHLDLPSPLSPGQDTPDPSARQLLFVWLGIPLVDCLH